MRSGTCAARAKQAKSYITSGVSIEKGRRAGERDGLF
jgi:hypothetical protein